VPTREYFQASAWHPAQQQQQASPIARGMSAEDAVAEREEMHSVRSASTFWAGPGGRTTSSSAYDDPSSPGPETASPALRGERVLADLEREGPEPRTAAARRRKEAQKQKHKQGEEEQNAEKDATPPAAPPKEALDAVGAQDAFTAGMMFALSRRALPSLRYSPPVPHLAAAEDQAQEKGAAEDGVWKLDECLRFATELAGRRARRKGWDGLAAEMRAAGWDV
jgi:hypothetical protein